MKETVTFTSVKSDRESNGSRYLNMVTEDGRELTASYPLDPANRKSYHATPEWVDALKTSLGQPVEVDVRDGKWVGQFKEGKGGGKGGWQPKSETERNEIIAQSSLNAAVALVTAMVNDRPLGTWIADVQKAQEQFFLATLRLARQSSGAEGNEGRTPRQGAPISGSGAIPAAPEPSLGESGEGDKPPSATGSPESSETGRRAGGYGDDPAAGRLARSQLPEEEGEVATVPVSEHRSESEPGEAPLTGGTRPRLMSGSGSEQRSGAGAVFTQETSSPASDASSGDSLFGSNGPASPTQLERLEHVYGGRLQALKAAFRLHNEPVAWGELSAEQAATLIEEKVGVRG